jgi:PPOX class probable F420-dependent enzyme
MAKLTPDQIEFLRLPHPATVALTRPDGSPHQTVVWIDTDNGDVLFNTAEGRAKPRFLRGNPTASVMVIDPNDDHHWLTVSGPAELSHDGAYDHINALARKYLGPDAALFPADQERVIVRIHPEHIDSQGFSD